MRPRVFVSSVIKNFEQYREAARQGIEAAGGDPVLVNEDFPALATSSRNACLDGVDSCDIYIVVIGDRGGWMAPSGKLVVEEEYERARFRKMPVLAFIQNVKRDADGERLVGLLSDYVDGLFRMTFDTADDLRAKVEKAVAPHVRQHQKPQSDPAMIEKKLTQRFQLTNDTTLRFVLAPERDEEVQDVVSLDPGEFKQRILELGHARGVGLFSYEQGKTTNVEIDSLVVVQGGESRRNRGEPIVRLEISSGGIVTIDTNVTGRVNRGSQHGIYEGAVIVEADIISALQASMAFCNALFNELDPYKRHQRFMYNTALSGIGYRELVAEYREQSSFSMNMKDTGIVAAFDKPRLIIRDVLRSPEKEIEAALTMFRRRLKG